MSNPQNHPAFGHQFAQGPTVPTVFPAIPHGVPDGVPVMQWIADMMAAGGITFVHPGATIA